MEVENKLELWKELFEIIANTDPWKLYDVEAMARVFEKAEDEPCPTLSMN